MDRPAILLILFLLMLISCQPQPEDKSISSTTESAAETPKPTTTPAITTSTVSEPTADPSRIKFTLFKPAQRGIIDQSDSNLVSGIYQDPGAVVYHDGLFHMFYNNSNDFPPSLVNIIYATSSDGQIWTRVSTESVITEEDIPYDVFSYLAAAVIVEDDGTWVLYFYTRDSGASVPSSRIGRATSSNPLGPWTVDANPVLLPGEGSWDSTALQRPTVLKVRGTYYAYYVAISPDNPDGVIGMATSSDGIYWQKHPDPVLRPEDTGLGKVKLKYPRVLAAPDGWLMFYHVSGGNLKFSQVRLASSSDGIHWVDVQTEAVFGPYDYVDTGASTVYLTSPVYKDGVYYMFMELLGGTTSRINLATFDGRIFTGERATGISDLTLPLSYIDKHGVSMRLVPAGVFSMGSDTPANGPIHPVLLSDFYIDTYEVTNAQFADFLQEEGIQQVEGRDWFDYRSNEVHVHEVNGVWQADEGYENHPVVNVNWHGASAFCAWRGGRLPTEAEWEKAARGTTFSTYPWGEEIDCEHANFKDCGLRQTLPVDSLPEGISPYGVYNMAGNVSEWTADWAHNYPNELEINPSFTEKVGANVRIVRGGSWYSTQTYLRVFHRNFEFAPTSSASNIGFRCAQTP